MMRNKKGDMKLVQQIIIMLVITGILIYFVNLYISDRTSEGLDTLGGFNEKFDDGDTFSGAGDLCACEPSSGFTSYELNPTTVKDVGLFKEGTHSLLLTDEWKIEAYLDSWHSAGVDSLPIGYLSDFKSNRPALNLFCITPSDGKECSIQDFRNTYYVGGASATSNTCYFSAKECTTIKETYSSFEDAQLKYKRE